jgi:hypothetical protein
MPTEKWKRSDEADTLSFLASKMTTEGSFLAVSIHQKPHAKAAKTAKLCSRSEF